jgi:peroxiredoxin Q/BCP
MSIKLIVLAGIAGAVYFFGFPVGNVLKVGDFAPNFTVMDENSQSWRLSDQLGSAVVLYFYPRDETKNCTEQACSIGAGYSQFKDLKAVVAGINRQSPEVHKAFKENHYLPFSLLSDADGDVCRKYGALRAISYLPPKRITFVIDADGKIAEIMPDVDVASHTQKLLEILKKLSPNN